MDAISPAKDSSVPGRTQTATPASSDAANPRVPVPKSRVVSLSPTFAGRDWLADEHVASRWRLQELPDGDVRLNLDFSGGPILGRCYDVFYNQVCVGRLEIRPGYAHNASTPKVITEVELDKARLLSFHSIVEFLHNIAMHVCEQKPESGEHFDANQAIVSAVTEMLWQNQQITEFSDLDGQDWSELSVHLQGYASRFYWSRKNALQKGARGHQ